MEPGGVMNYGELREKIGKDRQSGDCFIKWWGDDEALVDYELLDRFLAKGASIGEVAGFELFDLEGIWRVIAELDPDPLSRVLEGEREIIRWAWQDRQGTEQVTVFPFTPEGLMELMESEFLD